MYMHIELLSVCFFVCWLSLLPSPPLAVQVGWFICAGSAGGGFAVMYTSAKAQFSPTGQVVDAGLDLSMTEGMTE